MIVVDWLLNAVGIQAVQYSIGGIACIVAGWVLKRIPNEVIKAKLGLLAYSAGVACTLGLSKWKFSKHIWGKVVEPFFIDLIDNVVGNSVQKFIDGLRSDNKK
tara:strand:- start:399 stop:707 length:309 start_codon:yes stop_codon:yes gene_type:complete